MKLIVGLGNPGKDYERTRHNLGFEAIDAFAAKMDFGWKKSEKHDCLLSKGVIDDMDVMIIKPQTFMNESGHAVHSVASYYKISPEDILVIHDEMDLPPGRMMFISKGGTAGHNGVTDIQERLGTQNIPRLRIGIGRPVGHIAKENWVLGMPNPEDRRAISETIRNTPDAIRDWIVQGTERSMNRWNTRT